MIPVGALPVELEKRVANGSELLTRKYQGWYTDTSIDLTTLDQELHSKCVLAQASGKDYYKAKADLNMDTDTAIYYGFYLTDAEADAGLYPVLTDLWVDEIRRLRRGESIVPLLEINNS